MEGTSMKLKFMTLQMTNRYAYTPIRVSSSFLSPCFELIQAMGWKGGGGERGGTKEAVRMESKR